MYFILPCEAMAEAMYYQVADPSVLGRQYSALGQTFTVTNYHDDDLDDSNNEDNEDYDDDGGDDDGDDDEEDYDDDGDEPRLQLRTTFLTSTLLTEAKQRNKGSG